MRKNELIAMLQAIQGNPEVMLWNSTVGDYQKISRVLMFDLLKQTEAGFLERCELEKCRGEKDPNAKLTQEELAERKKDYKRLDYEVNSFVRQSDIDAKRYRRKTVILIDPKPRGETSIDRTCTIEY